MEGNPGYPTSKKRIVPGGDRPSNGIFPKGGFSWVILTGRYDKKILGVISQINPP